MGDAAQPGDAAGAPPAVAGPGLQAPALAGPGLQAPALDPGLQAPALPELEGDLGDIVMSEGTPDELIAALKRAGITTVADLELFKGETGATGLGPVLHCTPAEYSWERGARQFAGPQG